RRRPGSCRSLAERAAGRPPVPPSRAQGEPDERRDAETPPAAGPRHPLGRPGCHGRAGCHGRNGRAGRQAGAGTPQRRSPRPPGPPPRPPAPPARDGPPATLPPPDSIAPRHVPPIPRHLAEELLPYENTRSAAFADWHPTERRLLVLTRFAQAAQLHEVAT